MAFYFMIEIEKSYIVNDRQALHEILRDFEYLGEKQLEDMYFDYASLCLLRQRKFLRIRDRQGLELKMVVAENLSRRSVELVYNFNDSSPDKGIVFNEISGHVFGDSICPPLMVDDALAVLRERGLGCYLSISVTRKTYQSQMRGARIDVDHAAQGLVFIDVELLAGQAVAFDNFLNELREQAALIPSRGKFPVCLQRFNEEAYAIFEEVVACRQKGITDR